MRSIAIVPITASGGSAVKVLLVDDEVDILQSTGLLLEFYGYRVVTTSAPGAALALARAERPDVILLDAVMPAFDLAAMMAALRADPALKAIPVLLVSASEDLASLKAQVGADGHLSKPFRPRALVDAVRSLVQRRALAPQAKGPALDETAD
ncbi:MAG TPA: response regulator, partial [Candidatus Thermoplasmatota archaeon]|nr:response regulator [Candidatus Thermoplasmatota archaeon]